MLRLRRCDPVNVRFVRLARRESPRNDPVEARERERCRFTHERQREQTGIDRDEEYGGWS